VGSYVSRRVATLFRRAGFSEVRPITGKFPDVRVVAGRT